MTTLISTTYHNGSGLAGFRRWLYFSLVGMRGQPLRAHYRRYLRETREGIPPGSTPQLLRELLAHCKEHVPYYAETMGRLGDCFSSDPEGYLAQMPVLTKDIIRTRFDDLKSNDLSRRRWYLNTSGGSTGEPVRFIQDWESAARAGAVSLLFSKLVGRELGERCLMLWGSQRDVSKGAERWRARVINKITNTTFVNAFCMTPEAMRECLLALNVKRPSLIVGYATAVYDLARFAEEEGIAVVPQAAIITSAVTLHPFMRETIERVFGCKVFNRYGCREVGDIACEVPGRAGLWVAPWGNYIEVVDKHGNRVPEGVEGEILVTSLTNYAMPFVRYRIGDIGEFLSADARDRETYGQVLKTVRGRIQDTFVSRNGTLIDPGYFEAALYFKTWIVQFQVIQKSVSHIVYRIVPSDAAAARADLETIRAETRTVMGHDCDVSFEFVDEIAPCASGKHRYLISEIAE